jgi:uncharacterized protein (TIGR02246 family)
MDDIEGVRRLVFLYGQLLDDARFAEWEALFTDDAVFTVWGNVYEGRKAIREGIGAMMTTEYPGKHVSYATVADFDGDQAWAWSDFTALADAGPGQWGRSYIVATIARYYDHVVRVDGRWLFARRQIRMGGEPLPDGARPSPAR